MTLISSLGTTIQQAYTICTTGCKQEDFWAAWLGIKDKSILDEGENNYAHLQLADRVCTLSQKLNMSTPPTSPMLHPYPKALTTQGCIIGSQFLAIAAKRFAQSPDLQETSIYISEVGPDRKKHEFYATITRTQLNATLLEALMLLKQNTNTRELVANLITTSLAAVFSYSTIRSIANVFVRTESLGSAGYALTILTTLYLSQYLQHFVECVNQFDRDERVARIIGKAAFIEYLRNPPGLTESSSPRPKTTSSIRSLKQYLLFPFYTTKELTQMRIEHINTAVSS